MAIPAPSEKQGRLLWLAITALALGVLLAFLGLLLWMFGWVFQRLSSVILPLAIAGIIAYVLDPLVGFFERKRVPRKRAILLVYFLGITLLLLGARTVIPPLLDELRDLVEKAPEYSKKSVEKVQTWLATSQKSKLGMKVREAWTGQIAETLHNWSQKVLPIVSEWMVARISKVVSWASFLVGLALVPVYLFYFLS